MKLRTMLSLAAAAALLAAGTAHAQVKLRYAHVGVANAPQTLYADEVAKLIKERTNGRVEIQVFANSQLGGVGEMVDGVKSGAISMGHHDFASLGKIVPNTAVFNTPFVYRDPGHALRATDPRTSKALQEINKELVEKGNMRIVGSFFQGTRELTSKEKVLLAEGHAGQEVPRRSREALVVDDHRHGRGGHPRRSLRARHCARHGARRRQENPLPNIYNLKLYEVQKYVMMTNHMQSVLSVFFNEKVWQSISPADRKIIEDTLAEVGAKTLEWDEQTAAKYRSDLEAKGMVFIEAKDGLDIPAFQKAVLAQVNKDFPEWTNYIQQIQAVK
jgi:TRAP-type C4-dicarboxylate transport system substrate-binding protein